MVLEDKVFAIIVPCYNVEKWLPLCCDSIYFLEYEKYVTLLIDDGSDDDSGVLIDEMSFENLRFSSIHQLNSGVSFARNVALCMATGDYVLFVDSDDMLFPNALDVVNRYLEKHPQCDIIQFGYQEGDMKYCAKTNFLGQTDIFFQTQHLPPRTVWGSAYRRNLAQAHVFPVNLTVGEDTEYAAKCFFDSEYIGVIAETLYFYRVDVASVMHSSMTFEKLHSVLMVIKDINSYIHPRKTEEYRAKDKILMQLRKSFHQMLYHYKGDRHIVLDNYRHVVEHIPASYYAIKLIDCFPWLYFLYMKFKQINLM